MGHGVLLVLTMLLSGIPDAQQPSADRTFELLGYAMIGTAAADVLSTEYGIERGLREGNPLLGPNKGTRVAGSAAYMAGVWWGTRKLHERGNTKWAKAIRIATIALYGYATANNLRR